MGDTVVGIVKERGGPSKFAQAVGRTPGAVRLWNHRSSFPRDAWPEIIKAFPELTLDRLIALEGVAHTDIPRPAPTEEAA